MKIFKCRNSTRGPNFVSVKRWGCELVWARAIRFTVSFHPHSAGIWDPLGVISLFPSAVEVPSVSGGCKAGFKGNISDILNRELNTDSVL